MVSVRATVASPPREAVGAEGGGAVASVRATVASPAGETVGRDGGVASVRATVASPAGEVAGVDGCAGSATVVSVWVGLSVVGMRPLATPGSAGPEGRVMRGAAVEAMVTGSVLRQMPM